MTRPHCDCKIRFEPLCRLFKPDAAKGDVEVVDLTAEEAEALRLKNIEELDQTAAAEKMGISQSTFQRILTSAYKKVSIAIIYGKGIKICKVGEHGSD